MTFKNRVGVHATLQIPPTREADVNGTGYEIPDELSGWLRATENGKGP